MDVREIDPADDVAFAGWWEVMSASDRFERPGEPGWLQVEQQQISLAGQAPEADIRTTLLVARESGAAVGAARLELPVRDNLHLVESTLAVHPEHRRRGVGRALDAAVCERARSASRTTVLSYADLPPSTGEASAGLLGGLALDYDDVQRELRRDIDLPLDPVRITLLEQQIAPHTGAYDVRLWWDRTPEDLLDDRAELSRAMSTDIPKDGMDWREEVWGPARIRRDEDLVAKMDRRFVAAGAVHRSSGRLVAYTTMGLPRSAPERAYQWDTLVLEGHRGHRLGTLVKLAALQQLTVESPASRFISTWNAQENAPMICVNDALGARVNGGLAVLQKVLA